MHKKCSAGEYEMNEPEVVDLIRQNSQAMM